MSEVSERKDNILDENTNRCSIISLKPKETIFEKLKDISEDSLDLEEDKINKFLDRHLLESHTVPVCIPLLNSPNDLYSFIKDNSKVLFDFMLTAWPFPIGQWHFTSKDMELLNEFVDIKFFPVVCKAVTKPVKSTMDLAVTFATPTNSFADYIVESIASKKMTLSEEEMTQLEFIMSTGIAIVTNYFKQSENQDTLHYFSALNDSKNYLTSLGDNMVKTLFYFYFKNKEEFPEESSNAYLNKWFNTKTYLGMYMFTDPSVLS